MRRRRWDWRDTSEIQKVGRLAALAIAIVEEAWVTLHECTPADPANRGGVRGTEYRLALRFFLDAHDHPDRCGGGGTAPSLQWCCDLIAPTALTPLDPAAIKARALAFHRLQLSGQAPPATYHRQQMHRADSPLFVAA